MIDIDILVGNTSINRSPLTKTLSQSNRPLFVPRCPKFRWFGGRILPGPRCHLELSPSLFRQDRVQSARNQIQNLDDRNFYTPRGFKASWTLRLVLQYRKRTSIVPTNQVYHFYLQVAPSCSAGQLLSHRHLLLLQVSVLLDSTFKTLGAVLHGGMPGDHGPKWETSGHETCCASRDLLLQAIFSFVI